MILCTLGTTFRRDMIWLIVNDADVETAKDVYVLNRIPFMDAFNLKEEEEKFADKIKKINRPRLMFTHLPYKWVSVDGYLKKRFFHEPVKRLSGNKLIQLLN